MNSQPNVRHNAAASRYEIEIDGKRAVVDYVLEQGAQVFTHTLVPPELRGRGLAELLVRAALVDAQKADRRVVPACSYVAKFIERNTEFAGLVAPSD